MALAIELFTDGSLNTFAQPTNVDINNRLISYDILELGDSLLPVGMLIVLDNLLNKITSNREKRRQTYIFIDEMYLLFAHQYTAKFLYRIWKRVRKYGAFAIGITQNVEICLKATRQELWYLIPSSLLCLIKRQVMCLNFQDFLKSRLTKRSILQTRMQVKDL